MRNNTLNFILFNIFLKIIATILKIWMFAELGQGLSFIFYLADITFIFYLADITRAYKKEKYI